MSFLEAIEYAFTLLFYNVADLVDYIGRPGGEFERWRRWGFRFAWISLASLSVMWILAIPIGIWIKTGAIFPYIGILSALFVFAILIWWEPLAIIIGMGVSIGKMQIVEAPQKGLEYGKKWLKIALAIVLWVLIISVLFTIIPFYNEWQLIAPMILFALTLAIAGSVWGKSTKYRKVVWLVLVTSFTWCVFTMTMPKTSAALATKVTGYDSEAAQSVQKGTGWEDFMKWLPWVSDSASAGTASSYGFKTLGVGDYTYPVKKGETRKETLYVEEGYIIWATTPGDDDDYYYVPTSGKPIHIDRGKTSKPDRIGPFSFKGGRNDTVITFHVRKPI